MAGGSWLIVFSVISVVSVVCIVVVSSGIKKSSSSSSAASAIHCVSGCGFSWEGMDVGSRLSSVVVVISVVVVVGCVVGIGGVVDIGGVGVVGIVVRKVAVSRSKPARMLAFSASKSMRCGGGVMGR